MSTLRPLEQLRWRDHRQVLRWLQVCYRDPHKLLAADQSLRSVRRVTVVTLFVIHTLPYLALLALAGRFAVLAFLEPGAFSDRAVLTGHLIDVSRGLAMGVAIGLLGAVFSGVVFFSAFGVLLGIIFGVVIGLPPSLVSFTVFGLVLGVALNLTVFGGSSRLAVVSGISSPIAIAIIGFDEATSFVASNAVFALGALTGFCRLYYLPWHWLLIAGHPGSSWQLRHPIFRDRMILTPLPGAESFLVRFATQWPQEGMQRIEQIITESLGQRAMALRAKIRLIARAAAAVASLEALEGILNQLPEGDTGVLAQARAVRDKALQIGAKQHFANAARHAFFRHNALHELVKLIHDFEAQIAGFREPLASEFRRAAQCWLQLAEGQLLEARQTLCREPAAPVFRAGDPVQQAEQAFLLREKPLAAIEGEVLRTQGGSGILLYGRRRLGKTTLLKNLPAALPNTVIHVHLDMQDPEVFASQESLLAALTLGIEHSWPMAPNFPGHVSLAAFHQFLRACSDQLQAQSRQLLISIDEFERIDEKIGSGEMSEDLLVTLRNCMQTQQHIAWLFAGAHDLLELRHARWSSYFVGVRTVEMEPFSLQETRVLLTDPLRSSPNSELRSNVNYSQFWGPGCVDRIHEQAGGWPQLVQAVAVNTVEICNREQLTSADAAVIDRALLDTITSSDAVLAELMLYKSREYPDTWDYLQQFTAHDELPPPTDAELRRRLKRFLLVADTGHQTWKLRVPLMQRWLQRF
jgi:type II secretory pathway predicted ATPase ExeA